MLITLTGHYALQNLLLLLHLNGPDTHGLEYNSNFYRAALILKALDAGFWSTMRVKPVWLRNILSIIMTLYFALFPEHAEEVVSFEYRHPQANPKRRPRDLEAN